MSFLDAIREPEIREIFLYWLKRRPSGGVPARGSIDPADIPPKYLPHLFFYQREEDGQFRCKLIGTGINRVSGSDATGLSLDKFLPAMVARARTRLYRRVLDSARPSYFRGLAIVRQGEQRRYGRILLPVASSGQAADQIFGMVLYGPKEKPVPASIAAKAWERPAQIIQASEQDLEIAGVGDLAESNRAPAD